MITRSQFVALVTIVVAAILQIATEALQQIDAGQFQVPPVVYFFLVAVAVFCRSVHPSAAGTSTDDPLVAALVDAAKREIEAKYSVPPQIGHPAPEPWPRPDTTAPAATAAHVPTAAPRDAQGRFVAGAPRAGYQGAGAPAGAGVISPGSPPDAPPATAKRRTSGQASIAVLAAALLLILLLLGSSMFHPH